MGVGFIYYAKGGENVTKKEILKVLNANVRRLRREYTESTSRRKEQLRIRLEEAECIRDTIKNQNNYDKRSSKLERLL